MKCAAIGVVITHDRQRLFIGIRLSLITRLSRVINKDRTGIR